MNYLNTGDGYVESWPECDPDAVEILANAAFHAHLWERYYYPDMVSRGDHESVGILTLALNQVAWKHTGRAHHTADSRAQGGSGLNGGTVQMTKAEIEKAIAEITRELKGPMPNIERAMLVADRKELRDTLAQMVAREGGK